MLVQQVEDGRRPEEAVILAAEFDIKGCFSRNQRLLIDLIIIHSARSEEIGRYVERQQLRQDIPRQARITRPSGHKRNLVARKGAFAERRIQIGDTTAYAHFIGDAIKCAGLPANSLRRIEIDVDAHRRQEMDLVVQPHQVNARLEIERSRTDADSSLDVVRGLRFKIEARNGECKRASSSNSLIRITQSKCPGGAGEYCEDGIDAMLNADVRRPLPFALVERRDLGVIGVKSGVGIVDGAIGVTGVDHIALNTAAD